MIWVAKHPQFHPEMLGFIPMFLNERDPRPAVEQFNTNYQSGWLAQPGFTMAANGNLLYPGDPPLELLCEAQFRDELIRFYNYEYVAVVQPDGSFEACRMD
jgi:hypothetical protein